MRRLITFCVLLLFSTLTESIPFLPEYQKEYPKQYQQALANTYTNFAHPQPHYSDSKYEGLMTKETISQLPIYNYAIRNQPITQGRTVEEMQKKLQEQRPFIKERIDYKIQPPYTPVEIREIKLNTVPEPYIPQNFRRVESIKNIGNIDPIRQSHSEANAKTAALNAKEAQIDRTTTKPNLKQTNIYTPQKHSDANFPSSYHQVRQLIQSNPKLQNVITSVKNKKRYLVVHPDGRVEHVDNLEPIIQKHPEHILVNAGILRNHVPPINPHTYPVGASIPNPPHNPVPVIPNATPTVATAAAATASAVTGGPVINPVPKPRISHEPANTAPETLTTAATAIKTPITLLPTKTSTTPISKLAVPAAPSSSSSSAVVASATSVSTTPSTPGVPIPPTATTIDRNTNKPATLTAAATVIKTPITLSPTKTSTTATTKFAVTAAPSSSSSSAVVAPATSIPTTPSIPGVPISPTATTKDGTMNKLHAALTTKSIVHPPVVSKPTSSSRTHVNTLSTTAPHTTTSKASDTPTTTSKAPNSSVFSTSSSLTATSYETTPIVKVTKSIPTKSATSSHSAATSDTDSSTSKVNSDSSVSTSSNVTIPKIVADSAITDEPCVTVDESSIPESCATTGICAEVSSEVTNDVPVFESDNNQSVGAPVVWFEATDAGFWDQLLEDESYNVIYFINVPPQPIIEKDTKTTVFPNGTIIEEITETKRNRECDEPTVTKTVRLIEPKE